MTPFRKPFESQHAKSAEIPLKSKRHCWNLHDSTYISCFLIILRDWVAKNVSDSDMRDLTTVSKHINCWCKYSFCYRESLPQLGQTELSKNQTAAFLKSPSNSKCFEKKIAFLGHVFPKLRIAKDI